MTSPDFLIFGLGPAGCAAAIFAAKAGASVALAGRPNTGLKFGEHLPSEANPLLDELGVRPAAVNCAGVVNWWNGVESSQDGLFHPLGEGRFVGRPAFEKTLLAHARDLGVQVWEGFRLERKEGSTTTLQGSRTVAMRPQTIIDATGRAAAVARQFGARRKRWDRLSAIGLRTASDHPDQWLLVEPVAEGWWYTCPLPGGQRSFVFLTDADLPQFELARTTQGWMELMGPRISRLFDNGAADLLSVAPADSAWTTPSKGEGWVAIGDAAISFDPLASRGLHHALAGAREAVFGLDSGAGRFEKYLKQKSRYYGLERRFQGEEFWERRRFSRVPTP